VLTSTNLLRTNVELSGSSPSQGPAQLATVPSADTNACHLMQCSVEWQAGRQAGGRQQVNRRNDFLRV